MQRLLSPACGLCAKCTQQVSRCYAQLHSLLHARCAGCQHPVHICILCCTAGATQDDSTLRLPSSCHSGPRHRVKPLQQQPKAQDAATRVQHSRTSAAQRRGVRNKPGCGWLACFGMQSVQPDDSVHGPTIRCARGLRAALHACSSVHGCMAVHGERGNISLCVLLAFRAVLAFHLPTRAWLHQDACCLQASPQGASGSQQPAKTPT